MLDIVADTQFFNPSTSPFRATDTSKPFAPLEGDTHVRRGGVILNTIQTASAAHIMYDIDSDKFLLPVSVAD